MLRRLARSCVRLYPRAWRERYGEELDELLGETEGGVADLVDVLRSGLHERREFLFRRFNGGSVMVIGPAQRHPTAFALMAAALMSPTLALVVLSLLGHELGLTAIAAAVDPLIVSLTSARLVDLALVLAPVVALLVALAPLVEVGYRGGEHQAVATIAVRLRAANLAVVLVAIALGVLLVGHMLAESI